MTARLLAAVLATGLASGATVTAVTRPPEAPADRALRLVKPAVVRIESHATASVSVAQIDFDQAALEGFARRDVASILASGRRFATSAAAEAVVEDDLEHEFVANPGPYLTLGDRVADPYDSTQVGSGWLADGDGTVVTAADVLLDEAAVTAAATEQERQVVTAALNDVTPTDIGLTVPFTDVQKANLVNAALSRVVPSIQVSGITSTTTVQWAVASGRKDASIVIDHHGPHGSGLAVLKVDGRPFVSAPVAVGTSLTAGTPIVVVGYPASAASDRSKGSPAPTVPEAATGTVAARLPEGSLATDTGYTQGVVGGPVLDSDGEVVGVAAKRDEASAVLPVTDVVHVLDEAHARTSPNAVTRDYRKAAGDMSRHWYKKALPLLQAVGVRAPNVPWINEQIQEAGTETALGHDESPSVRPFPPVAVAAVLFAMDAVAVTTVLRRRLLRSRSTLTRR